MMRPAAVVAWVLFVALLVSCPQTIVAVLAVAVWSLGQPVALGVALAVSLLWCAARPASSAGLRWAA
ncbi:hypothetical protein OG897_13490 [Streptomyces sp. NBC_00237]|uniref:hypothetical protein n=1 Tax=Streptomyces sp. NBC_00237 TaxID=2975687 RepID=UPI00225A96DF|nr:hypothetical protein [Streptomyces sp. NBC_00237]MCX5202457.1 hypothetical protein [Streptomyces sp. NBC_00237]